MKWLFPPVRLPVPANLAQLFLSNPNHAFGVDELIASARIGAYRLTWLLNQMTRDGILVARVAPGPNSNAVTYRLHRSAVKRLERKQFESDKELQEFFVGLSGRKKS